LFVVLAATDAVDGYVARARNEITTFGKFVDPLADKLLVTAALIALVGLGTLPSWVALVIISRELVVSGLRMVAIAEGRVIAASIHGKIKTVLQIVAIVAFLIKGTPALNILAGQYGQFWIETGSWILMIAALIMTVWSMADYLYSARDYSYRAMGLPLC